MKKNTVCFSESKQSIVDLRGFVLKLMSELEPGEIIDRGNGLVYEVEKVYTVKGAGNGVVYVTRGGLDPLAPTAIYFFSGQTCKVVTKKTDI